MIKNSKAKVITEKLSKNNASIIVLEEYTLLDIKRIKSYLVGDFGPLEDFILISEFFNCNLTDIIDTKKYYEWYYRQYLEGFNEFKNSDLKIDFALKLCNKIGFHYHYFKNNNFKINERKYGNVENHWNFITTILDRIRDSSEYIKYYDVKHYKQSKIAFGFYDLINHVYNLSSFINDLNSYLKVNNEKYKIKEGHLIFSNPKNLNGNDDSYMSYLRSLVSSNHSISTSKHRNYIEKKDTHFSPFSYWENNRMDDNYYDVTIILRTNSESIWNYYASTSEIYKYIQLKLLSIIFILEELYFKKNERLKLSKNTKIKDESDFNNMVDYINYLNKEHDFRIGNDYQETYNFYSKYISFEWNHEKYKDIIIDYQKEMSNEIKNRGKYIQSLDESDYNSRFEELLLPISNFIHDNNLGYELSHINISFNDQMDDSSRINSKLILSKMDIDIDLNELTDDEIIMILNSMLYNFI